MKINRILLTVFISIVSIGAFARSTEGTPVYAFGYATCLGDSVVYLSAISPLEGAKISERNKFLQRRDEYARQLETALGTQYGLRFTCALFYAKSKAKAEKSYIKLRNRLRRSAQSVVEVPASEFTFTPLLTIE